MRRRLFNLAAAMSLILCCGIAGLWIRSESTKDRVTFPRPQGNRWCFAIKTYPGTLDLAILVMTIPLMDRPYWQSTAVLSDTEEWDRQWQRENLWLGFGFHRFPFDGRDIRGRPYAGHWNELFLPYWSLVVLTAALPVVWFCRRVARGRRQLEHRCIRCGYDLRATPDRCPECGAIPTKAA